MPCNLVRGILVCSVHAFSAQSSPTSQTPSCSFYLDLFTTVRDAASALHGKVCMGAGLASARCRCKCVLVKAA